MSTGLRRGTDKAWLAHWEQERRRERRPLMTVSAADLFLGWTSGKKLNVSVRVGRLALWKFESFRLRCCRASVPGGWIDAGTKTSFLSTLVWTFTGLTEGDDYVFELTVTEQHGVATVTEITMNIGFA